MSDAALFTLGAFIGLMGAICVAGLMVNVFGSGEGKTAKTPNAIVKNAEQLASLGKRMESARRDVWEDNGDVEEALKFAYAKAARLKADHLAVDVSAEEARALHRVVRAMHDGHCPECGCLGSAESFRYERGNCSYTERGHECPRCGFAISDSVAECALQQFRPYLNRSVEVFKNWRKARFSNESNLW